MTEQINLIQYACYIFCGFLVSSGGAIYIAKLIINSEATKIADDRKKICDETFKEIKNDIEDIKNNYVKCINCEKVHHQVDNTVQRIDNNVSKILDLLMRK